MLISHRFNSQLVCSFVIIVICTTNRKLLMYIQAAGSDWLSLGMNILYGEGQFEMVAYISLLPCTLKKPDEQKVAANHD